PVVMSNESGKLLDVYHRQFSASNLVLSIAGDVDLDKTMLAARGFMSVMPNRDLPEDPTPWLETKGALSGGLFAEVGPFDASGTAFTLA
ncbi:insulinase family protein, partial [Enterococcus faecium]|uniref:insulinase family protein n=1 Tax=Enterococcus faecium TaxID=1352 RepID=UPI003F43CCF1